MKPLPLADLPEYSAWAAYLLDPAGDPPGDPTEYTRIETYESIYRQVLAGYRSDPAPPAEFVHSVRARGRREPDAISIEAALYLASTAELVEREQRVVREALAPVAGEAGTVLDLGCGWGATLGTIVDAFPGVDVVGGEVTESGVEAARALHADRDRISAERFDFLGDRERDRTLLADRGADPIFFTNASLTTLPDVEPVVERLGGLARDGDVVAGVHLEPVDVHPDTDLGRLRRRYARLRGYDGELLGCLRRDDRLAVTDVAYDRVGANPLHPVSLVRWRPA